MLYLRKIVSGLASSLNFVRNLRRPPILQSAILPNDFARKVKVIKKGETSQIFVTGKHSYGLSNIHLFSCGEGAHLFVGSFCSIAYDQRVFLGCNHKTDWTTTYPFGHILLENFPSNIQGHPSTKGHVIIENDVWIGFGCTFMSGIRIGSGSVIAAYSVVVKDVAPYTIVGGNPARIIKQRFSDEIIRELLEIRWWDHNDSAIKEILPLLLAQPTNDLLRQMKKILSIS
jgi:acetyltransferase-like isoleucine patch superfamily enzyme